MSDPRSRRSSIGAVPVGHVIHIPHTLVGRTCSDAVTQLVGAVTQYTDCASRYALSSRVCEKCVDYYLNAEDLLATNLSVRFIHGCGRW